MQDIMIRIQTDDFEAWKEQHYRHAANRARYGITDGPAYRDLEDPGAALFHISVADMDTAMGWFRSDTFNEATRLAKVTSRHFYLTQATDLTAAASPGNTASPPRTVPGTSRGRRGASGMTSRRSPCRPGPGGQGHRPRRLPQSQPRHARL